MHTDGQGEGRHADGHGEGCRVGSRVEGRRARWLPASIVALASLALLASACSSSHGSSGSAASAHTTTVTIDLTPQGCAPKPAKITAGTVQFNVSNTNASAVSEAELRTSNLAKILGEQENLTSGLSGSYLVARKIRIFVENWDRDYLRDQENTIGRAKLSGAPLSGGKEFTTPDFAATGSDGQPAIPAHAHIRLASFEHNGGTRILRRGYSLTDGIGPAGPERCSAGCSSSRS